MKEVSFQIDGYDDRRNLVSILAANGYRVRISKEETYSAKSFVHVELEKNG